VTVAARGSRRLMVGFRAGIVATPAVREFATRHPDVLVDLQRIEADDRAAMLLDGRIDVAYVRWPIDEAGLRVVPLYTEPRVAVVPAGRRLAGREQITEADLLGRGAGDGRGHRGVRSSDMWQVGRAPIPARPAEALSGGPLAGEDRVDAGAAPPAA
jgi:DNA-binding transcriptional LysR family regulator